MKRRRQSLNQVSTELGEGHDLASLESSINKGLSAYLAAKMPALQMNFQFDAFPPSFTVNQARAIAKSLSEEQAQSIRAAVEERKPVYSS
jgi:hypothetical protein